jgi:polyphosphate kinase
MPRNLYNRVELDVPVSDEKVRAQLVDVLDRSLADNTHCWGLGSDGVWRRRRPDGERRDVQAELIELHAERAATGASVETPVA